MPNIPFGYGECEIQFDSTFLPDNISELNSRFKVGDKSIMNFEEINIEKTSVDYTIQKKVLGFRMTADMYLYIKDEYDTGIIDFIYYYYLNTNSDKHFWIYPYVPNNNFYAKSKTKFHNFILDKMEIIKNKEGKPQLGRCLHITGRNANMIPENEFNYLIYRKTEDGLWYKLPDETIPHLKWKNLLPNIQIIN